MNIRLITITLLPLAFLALLLSNVLFYQIPKLTETGPSYGGFGTLDFIEYWSAFQLYRDGADPYNPALLLPIQQQLGWKHDTPLMMWNPPWVLTALSPILAFDFQWSARLWLIVNFMLAIVTGTILSRLYKPSSLPIITVLACTFIFYPTWTTLELGQLSIVVGLGVALAAYGLVKHNDWCAGLGLLIITFKPHVAFLFLIALIYFVIVQRRTMIIVYFLTFFFIACGANYLVAPHAFSGWANRIIGVGNVTPYLTLSDWYVATLVGITYLSLDRLGLSLSPVLMIIIPGLAAISCYGWLIHNRSRFEWQLHLPPLVVASYMFSPYGWIFDQFTLIVVPIATLSLLANSITKWEFKHLTVVLALFALTPLAHQLGRCCIRWNHEFFWFPIPLLLIWFISLKFVNDQTRNVATIDK